MDQRPKMELEVNKPAQIKLLKECVEGTSKYGKYFLYNIQNGDGSTEYSLFAPEQLHELLKPFKVGDILTVTKMAAQRGTKLIVTYEVAKIDNNVEHTESSDDFLYQAMEKSLEQSISLAKRFNSVPIDKLAISLFIARTKGNLSFSN